MPGERTAGAGPDPLIDALLRSRPGDRQADPGDVLVAMVGRPGWHRSAACRSIGPDPFFPTRGGSLELARHLCSTCSVAGECLAEALALDEKADYGFRGGMSARQRRLLRRCGEAA